MGLKFSIEQRDGSFIAVDISHREARRLKAYLSGSITKEWQAADLADLIEDKFDFDKPACCLMTCKEILAKILKQPTTKDLSHINAALKLLDIDLRYIEAGINAKRWRALMPPLKEVADNEH